jgi:hypothetical protein
VGTAHVFRPTRSASALNHCEVAHAILASIELMNVIRKGQMNIEK